MRNECDEKKLLCAGLITFFDQLSISVPQFVVGLGFIYVGTRENYGMFTFFISIFYFWGGIQNAIINTPLSVLHAKLKEEEEAKFLRGLFGMLLLLITISIVLVFTWSFLYKEFSDQRKFTQFQLQMFLPLLAILMLREFWRTVDYAKLQPIRAFRRNFTFAIFFTSSLVVLAITKKFSLISVFPAMSISILLTMIPSALRMYRSIPNREHLCHSFQRVWSFSRWGLLGATCNWLQNNIYVYLTFYFFSSKEIAYLAASHLLLKPIFLLARSWGNYFRPIASRRLAEGNTKGAVHVFLESTVFLFFLLVIYSVFLILALKFLPYKYFPAHYRNSNYIILWTIITIITIIRLNTTALFQASLNFKSLALRGFASASCGLIVAFLLMSNMGPVSALYGTMASEFLLMLFLLSGLKGVLHSVKETP